MMVKTERSATRKRLTRTGRFILRFLAIIVLMPVLYVLIACVVMYIPVNTHFKPCEKDAVEIYLLTNGVHTDIVVPLKNSQKDWTSLVDPTQTMSLDAYAQNVAFGWGDKGFYLETPTWDQLKMKTAFNALFFLSTTAMHVTFYNDLTEGDFCRKICISQESYAALAEYIENSFGKDAGGSRLITGAHYSGNDLFYEAKGTYNLFFTCNTWANNALKKARLKACLWTALDKGIFYQYRE